MAHKAGFVNIIGRPNVGKSTLINALVGERLSIITSKAQTTRHRILGIVNGEDFQIIYSDTPGIIKPEYELQKSMMGFVKTALDDADVLLAMTDVVESKEGSQLMLENLVRAKMPTILLVNKIDKAPEEVVQQKIDYWKNHVPEENILPISALKKINIDVLFQRIIDLIPESPAFYPKDQLSDKPERFFVCEAIREQILLHYKEEIPYSVEVVVPAFKEDDNIIRIAAEIITNRKTQKPILIGKGGSMIKKVGVGARVTLEKFFGKQVYLELFVKIRENWRNNNNMLRGFGYK